MKILFNNTKKEIGGDKPLKKLIYLVCMGPDKYKDMLNMCLYSLVKNGKFDGDIVVLSDFDTFDNRYGINLDGVNLRIVNVWKDVERFTEWGMSKIAWYCKTTIFDYVDQTHYSDVLYIDIDSIVNGNINELFSQLQSYPILVQNNGKTKIRHFMNTLYAITSDMTKYDKMKFDDCSCCAGIFLIHETQFRVLELWRESLHNYYKFKEIGDQEPLALTIILNQLEIKNIDNVYFHKSVEKTNLIIAHFMSKRYEVQCEYFKRNVI